MSMTLKLRALPAELYQRKLTTGLEPATTALQVQFVAL